MKVLEIKFPIPKLIYSYPTFTHLKAYFGTKSISGPASRMLLLLIVVGKQSINLSLTHPFADGHRMIAK
jgi:hypothetical protein